MPSPSPTPISTTYTPLPLLPSGRSPHNMPRAAKRKLQKQGKSAARLPRMELDQRLDTLKVGLAQDSKLDRQFEARLEAALLH